MHRLYRLIGFWAILACCGGLRTVHAQVDTVRPFVQDTGAFHMTKSPTEAIILSTLLPGAGQVYLDQTWKVPIIWGIAGGFLAGALIQNGRYHTWADSAAAALARGDAYHSVVYANNREWYRDDRDKWWVYLGIAYVANILDAYIAANLYDFDVSNPTTSTKMLTPFYDPGTGTRGIGLSMRF